MLSFLVYSVYVDDAFAFRCLLFNYPEYRLHIKLNQCCNKYWPYKVYTESLHLICLLNAQQRKIDRLHPKHPHALYIMKKNYKLFFFAIRAWVFVLHLWSSQGVSPNDLSSEKVKRFQLVSGGLRKKKCHFSAVSRQPQTVRVSQTECHVVTERVL